MVSAIWSAFPYFEGHEQHDSGELLIYLLERLRDEEKWLMKESLTPTNIVNDVCILYFVLEFQDAYNN